MGELALFFLCLLFLLLCFLMGAALAWWWWKRQHRLYSSTLKGQSDQEISHLRTEVTELRASETRSKKLLTELESARSVSGKVPQLETQVSDLESELAELRSRASATDSLEGEIVLLRSRAERADELDLEVASLSNQVGDHDALDVELREARERMAELEAELETAKIDSVELDAANGRAAELDSVRSELEAVKLEAQKVSALRIDLDRADTEVKRLSTFEAELEKLRTEAQQVAPLRASLSQVETQAKLVPERDQTILDLRSQLKEVKEEKTSVDLDLTKAEGERAQFEKTAAVVPTRDATILELQAQLAKATKALKSQGAAQESAKTDAKAKKAKKKARKRASWQDGTTKLGTPGANHVDNLTVVSGIGPVMEKTLKSFGIQTWEQLADFTEEDVAKVTEAIGAFPGRIERDEWVKQAKVLCKNRDASALTEPAKEKARVETLKPEKAKQVSNTPWQQGTTKLGTPGAGHTDDLKVISGIGPVMEKTLKSFGIQTWEQLADFTEEDVAKVTEAIGAFPGRIERDEWVKQAGELVVKYPDRIENPITKK